MQRIANPSTSVRLRVPPPYKSTLRKQPDARVVESVDTRDLKSLAGNSVTVQVRPRAPFTYLSKKLKFSLLYLTALYVLTWSILPKKHICRLLAHIPILSTL
jgi:hypothetical protein